MITVVRLLWIALGIFGITTIYLIKGAKVSARLRTQVEQAELQDRLAKLEPEQYDAIRKPDGSKPASS